MTSDDVPDDEHALAKLYFKITRGGSLHLGLTRTRRGEDGCQEHGPTEKASEDIARGCGIEKLEVAQSFRCKVAILHVSNASRLVHGGRASGEKAVFKFSPDGRVLSYELGAFVFKKHFLAD